MSALRSKFIDQLQLKGLSKRTVENYVSDVALFARHYNASPLDLTTQHIRDYLLHLMRDHKRAPATVNLKVNSLKAFYALMAPGSTVMDGISTVKNVRPLPHVLSFQEIQRMIDVTTNIKHRAVLMVLYSAGLRLHECVDLKPQHIESQRGMIRVEKGKGNLDRYTLLSSKTLETLKTYFKKHRPGVWLFEGADGKQYTPRSIGKIVSTAAIKAKINKRVHPHMLRHSFATHLMEAGTALPVIQQLLGHASIRTTMVYIHVGQPMVDKIVSPLDRITEVANG